MIFWLKEYNDRLALEKAKKEKLIYNSKINVEWILYFYRTLLVYTMGSPDVYDPWQHHSNIFLAYVYSVIVVSQGLTEKTIRYYTNDKYILELKKSTLLSEADIKAIINNATMCLDRFRIYEGIFRKLFQIPITVTKLEDFRQYLPTFDELTDKQITALKYQILDPVFGVMVEENNKVSIQGRFHNAYGSPLLGTGCNFDWKTGQRIDCKLFSIPTFPFPQEIYKQKQGYTTPDCIKPIVLWNEAAHDVRKSYDIIMSIPITHQIWNEIMGFSPSDYLKIGAKKEKVIKWIDETIDDAKQVAENTLLVGKEIAKQAAALGSAAAGFIKNPPSASGIARSIGIWGLVAFGGYILLEKITE